MIDSSPVANVAILPAAGGLGIVVQPSRGLWAQLSKKWSPDKQRTTLAARRAEGAEAVRASTAADRKRILVAFDAANSTKEERKKRLGEEALEALTQPEISDSGAEINETELEAGNPSSTVQLSVPSTSDRTQMPSPSKQEDGQGREFATTDDEFEKDLELAKQLSLAEQRGYERGLAQLQAREDAAS